MVHNSSNVWCIYRRNKRYIYISESTRSRTLSQRGYVSKVIGDHPFKLAKALIREYGNRPPEQIMCVPEETVRLFMKEGGKRGEPT